MNIGKVILKLILFILYKIKQILFNIKVLCEISGMRQTGNVLQVELAVACLVYVLSWWPVEALVAKVALVWQWAI